MNKETVAGIKDVKKLPKLPHDDYPVGLLVYLRKDGHLYRSSRNGWEMAVER